MKNRSIAFWAIVVLFLTGIAACIISETIIGAIACALLGAAGFIAFIRADRKEH